MENNSNGRYDQNYISPTLSKLFLHFEKQPKIKNLKSYIKLLNLFVSVHIDYARLTLYELEEKSTLDTKLELSKLEEELSRALSLVNDVVQECRSQYALTFRQERMLNYAQNKMEFLWGSIDRLYWDIKSRFLYYYPDCLSEEVPYKKDYSEIMAIPISLN